MTEIEQQALLEPEPTRVVRAVEGSAYWGVDPSTLRVSIAWQHAADSGAATRSFPRTDAGGKRLELIYRETLDFVANELIAAPWPGLVLVEQPSGPSPNPQLVYAGGVVQAAIWRALHESPRGQHPETPPIIVETIPSARWKKVATGRGDAGSKRRGGKEEIIRWAQENGYTGHLDDEADAWGVATAARRLVRFAP